MFHDEPMLKEFFISSTFRNFSYFGCSSVITLNLMFKNRSFNSSNIWIQGFFPYKRTKFGLNPSAVYTPWKFLIFLNITHVIGCSNYIDYVNTIVGELLTTLY